MGTAFRLCGALWVYGLLAVGAASASAQTPTGALSTSVVEMPGASQVARVRIHGRVPSSLKLQMSAGSTTAPKALEHDGDTDVDVPLGTQLAVRPTSAQAPVALRRGNKHSLSGTIFVGVRSAATGRATTWSFRPIVRPKIVPLQWDPNENGYLTTIDVGLDGDQPDAKLVSPVTFVLDGENVERVSPDQIVISTPGAGGYATAKIFTQHYVPSVKISVHSAAGDDAFEADVDPGLTMTLTPSQTSIPAFGLGTAVITMSCSKADGSDGSKLAACAGHYMPTTTHGRLEPTDLELKAGAGPAHVTLYSASSGTTTVTVDGLRALHIELVWPWSLFLAGVAGALLGAVLRLLAGPRKGWRAMLVGSVATGVIIDVLLTLGVPLIHGLQQGAMTTEAGWFAVGVLGGLLGTRALIAIAQRLFGGGDKNEPIAAGSSSAKPAEPSEAIGS